jgi:hypothetical protein
VSRENKTGKPAAESREDFLARWSRRKLDAPHPERDAPAGEMAAATPSESPPAGPERELTDADMPPIGTLDGDSDYSPFMSPGVSDDLRREALRKLFNQPDYNVVDGLNDYDEDFTQFAGLGGIVTHEMKRMLQRELEAETAAAESTDVNAAPAVDPEASADDVTVVVETGKTDCVDTTTQNDDPDKGDVPPG